MPLDGNICKIEARLNKNQQKTATCYPYSRGYLAMQKRRKEIIDQEGRPGEKLTIPVQHWQEIDDREIDEILRCSGGRRVDGDKLLLEVMGRVMRIDPSAQRIEIQSQDGWQPAPSLAAFVTAVYLAKCRSLPLSGRWVSEKDLSCSEFFRGIHQLRTEPVLSRYGHDPENFIEAGERFGGVRTQDSGDAALRFWVFPAIPLKLILWCGDDELEPALTVMFDQSIDELLPADGIWALVQMVCQALAEKTL